MPWHWRTDHKSLITSIGELNYRDIGNGDPVVFVHGTFTNGGLWDDVIFYLPSGLRTIRPDFPIGGHSRPAKADADLTLTGLALLLLEIIEALDLSNITLVANEIGCAICQSAVASRDVRALRICRLMFTNSGSFDHLRNAADETDLAGLPTLLMRRDGRRQFFARLAWSAVPDEQLADLLGGFLLSGDIRRDAHKFLHELHAIEPGDIPTLQIEFPGPVSVIWGLDDFVSPDGESQKLARRFANSHIEAIENSRLLVPVDQPEILANAIIDLLNRDIDYKNERTQ